MKLYFKLFGVFFLLACVSANKKSISWMDTENCNDMESPCNVKNEIYTTNKVFNYQIIKDSSELIDTLYFQMKVLPGCFFGQTKIKYKYYHDFPFSDSVTPFNWEMTGIVENKNKLWIHPPRSFWKYMELTAFPDFIKTRKKYESWKSYLFIQMGYDDLDGMKTKSVLNYNMDTLVNLKSQMLDVKNIHTRTTYKNGETIGDFGFNKQYGFVYMNYCIMDSIKIKIKMLECSDL